MTQKGGFLCDLVTCHKRWRMMTLCLAIQDKNPEDQGVVMRTAIRQLDTGPRVEVRGVYLQQGKEGPVRVKQTNVRAKGIKMYTTLAEKEASGVLNHHACVWLSSKV